MLQVRDLTLGNVARSASQSQAPWAWVPGAHLWAPCLQQGGGQLVDLMGTVVGTPSSSLDWVPEGINFPGDRYVSVPAGTLPLGAGDSFTLFLTASSTVQSDQRIQCYSSGFGCCLFRHEPSNGMLFTTWSAASAKYASAGTIASWGCQRPIVGVRDQQAGALRIYVDGVLAGSEAESQRTIDPGTNLYIGASGDGSSRFWVGTMGVIGMFPFALTPSQVALLSADPLLPLRRNEISPAAYFTVVGGALIMPRAFNYGLSYWNKGIN